MKNNYETNQIAELSMENSFQSKGSKNFVLKSDYLNNTNNSKKNSFYFEQNMNSMNQKSLFRHSNSFIDQDEENENKDKNNHGNEKEIDMHMFHNNNIFNEFNENKFNRNKNNHL